MTVPDLKKLRMASFCPPGEDCLARPLPAARHREWIVERLERARIGLFLDYDGTLAPIAPTPEEAAMPDRTRSILRDLAALTPLAIVSGRDRPDVERAVGLETVVFAGSHGFDIRGPNHLTMQHAGAEAALPALEQAEGALRRALAPLSGVRIDRKRYAVAVHYRAAAKEDVGRVVSVVAEVRERHPSLRLMSGKKVVELQPDVDWNKGRAVAWLCERLGLDRDDSVVVYIGDDLTDEDAFREIRRRGLGFGMRIAADVENTAALYVLRDCDDARALLEALRDMLTERRALERRHGEAARRS